MGRKFSSAVVSKTSSTSAPTVSSVNASAQKSSILRSAFTPSHFQLHLFASVIQSFDSQQLRIHDTVSGRLKCQYETRPGTNITSLDWGYYGSVSREQKQGPAKKKRKSGNDPTDGAAVVSLSTSDSEVYFFSPAEAKVVGSLVGGHERGIRDFKFASPDYKQGWSLGEDGKLIQWDLVNNQILRTMSLPDPAVTVLATPSPLSPQILCASSTPYAIEVGSSDDFRIDRYDAFKNPIHHLFPSRSDGSQSPSYFLAADQDRYLNIYDISQKRLVRTLVASSGVVGADLPTISNPSYPVQGQVLSVLTRDGVVELFYEPFAQVKQLNGDLKSSRKNLTKRASASVRLVGAANKTKQVSITAASIQGPDLVIASAESGVDLSFQKIRWQDEGNGELLFDGVKEVVRSKSASTLNTATLNGVKDMGKSHVDESRTVVVNGGTAPHTEAIEILSSDSEEEEFVDEDDEMQVANSELNTNGIEAGSDAEMADADESENEGADQGDAIVDDASDAGSQAEEPSFGEMLAQKHPGTISIADTFKSDVSTLKTVKDGLPKIPAGMSLGTVLTQSLRTNDNNLLEACLHTLDIGIVKNTIQRLDSSLAGILLSKLADRLASRPGRYGHLITWVQWTCIAHGGAIAAQPDVTAKVRTLYNVLTQRSKTLDNLLLLKGKLDMLDAQLTFRKQLAAQRPPKRDDQDEPGIIYIEGKDNWDSSDDEDLDEDISRPVKKLAQGKGKAKATKRALEDLVDGDSSDEEDLIPLENGDLESETDEQEDSSEEDEPGLNGTRRMLVDDEAEVSGAEDSDPDDQGDGVGIDSSDDDDSSSDDGDEDVDDDDEEDSEMDSFINDGDISIADDEDDVHIPGDNDDDDDDDEVAVAPEPEPQPAPKAKSSKSKKEKKASRS